MENIKDLITPKQYAELCDLFDEFMHFSAILQKRPTDIIRALDATPDDLALDVKIALAEFTACTVKNNILDTHFELPYQGKTYMIYCPNEPNSGFEYSILEKQPPVTTNFFDNYRANRALWDAVLPHLEAISEIGFGQRDIKSLAIEVQVCQQAEEGGIELNVTPEQALTMLKNGEEIMVRPYGDDYDLFTGITIDDYEDQTDADILEDLKEFDDIQQWLIPFGHRA